MTLIEAIDTFEDSLKDIQNALASNIKDDIQDLPKWPKAKTQKHVWVQKRVRDLQIQEISEQRLYIIRRIQSRLSFTPSPYTKGVSEEEKAKAKAFPLAELYGGKLRGSQGLCPFHDEKTPSFHINKKKNTWKCYGCDTFGDTIDFVMKRDKVSFLEAVRTIIK